MNGPAVTVGADATVDEASKILVANEFAALPVVDSRGLLVGIVDEADLVRGRVVPDGWQVHQPPVRSVPEVMTAPAISGGPEDDVADVIATMLDHRIRSVPVVRDGRPIGIVSRRDVLRAVARGLRSDTTTDEISMASHDRGGV